MGSREERLLSEQLQRMADLGVEPVALPEAGAEPPWSPEDIDAGDPADIFERLDALQSSPAGPLHPVAEPSIPNDGHYIGLRNGSRGPGDEPAVTPAEERMIFGAPINRTVAEVEAVDGGGCAPPVYAAAAGTHGSPELDADAEKLIAMGQDPGPTLDEIDPSFVLPTGATPDSADFAEVEEAAPAWAVGDLCIYDDQLAEVIAVRDGGFDLAVWDVVLKKGSYEWSGKGRWGVDATFLTAIASQAAKLFADAFRQNRAADEAERAANRAHGNSDLLLKAHFALREAEGALALIGQSVSIAPAESTAA